MSAPARWWFAPTAVGRVAVLRTLAYLFIPVDVLLTTPWVRAHADVPGDLYQPLAIGRLLALPTPGSGLVTTVMLALLVSALAAATGRAPRILGVTVFLLYLEWMVLAYSYGKVDHDRFGYLVLLAVLPTVGRARWGDATLSEAAGWAVRAVQVAVVATYFLSTVAKLRYGGPGWLTGATLVNAILRKGTVLAQPLLDHPELLTLAQFGIVGMELASPLLLVLPSGRLRWAALGILVSFHVMTFLMIRIIFLPHLVAMAAFLPLERISRPGLAGRGAPGRTVAPASG